MYVDVLTKKILTRQEVKRLAPSTSLPQDIPADFLQEKGLAVLDGEMQPETLNGQQIVKEDGAELVDGRWLRSVKAVGTPVIDEKKDVLLADLSEITDPFLRALAIRVGLTQDEVESQRKVMR